MAAGSPAILADVREIFATNVVVKVAVTLVSIPLIYLVKPQQVVEKGPRC